MSAVRFSAMLVTGLLLATAAAAAFTPQATFRAMTDAVMVDVSVRDRGRAVTGLVAKDFTVLDNGVPQVVADVSYGKLPIDVTVALDVSFSVTGALLDQLRTAVAQLMRDLGKDDRLKLVLFNTRVNRVVDFTSDIASVERAIRSATAGGGTTILDAMSVALVSQAPPNRRQLLMFFTDGADSSSATTPASLIEVIHRTTATMSMVTPRAAPLLVTSSPSDRQQAELYRTLTRESGGTVLSPSTQVDLTATFRSILESFRSSYVLHFSPTGVDRAGFHTLKVAVERDGLQVTARRGYFGG